MFRDRKDAGERLVPQLKRFKGKENTLVLGLARGGVVVAYEIAMGLRLPLNVVVPRKIGAPQNSELAIGALMEGDVFLNTPLIEMLGISENYVSRAIEKELAQAESRTKLYRQTLPLPSLKDKTVILADDGIATGSTLLAAIMALRHLKAAKIIVAAPVAATSSLETLQQAADEVVCLESHEDFGAVGYYYQMFNQTEDAEVIALLKNCRPTT